MTPRERIDAALSHEQPDRTPIFEYVLLSPVADAILGRKFCYYDGEGGNWTEYVSEIGWEKALRNYARDRVELATRLGHDLMYVIPNPLPPDIMSATKNTDIERKYDGEDPVEIIKARNKRRMFEIGNNVLNDLNFTIYSYIKEEMKQRELDLDLFAPAYNHGVWTDTDLMQTMILDPDTAHEHFKLCKCRTSIC